MSGSDASPQRVSTKPTYVRAQAEAFASFVPEASRVYELDPSRTAFLGYSNGANFIGAFMLLHPHVVHLASHFMPRKTAACLA
jgi:predicted esterase